jgi:hypothetical protein
MTNNPITTSGALAIIYAIQLNSSSALETLNLSVKYFFVFFYYFKFAIIIQFFTNISGDTCDKRI